MNSTGESPKVGQHHQCTLLYFEYLPKTEKKKTCNFCLIYKTTHDLPIIISKTTVTLNNNHIEFPSQFSSHSN